MNLSSRDIWLLISALFSACYVMSSAMASAKLGLLIAAAVFPLAVAWSAFTDTSTSGQKSRGIYMVLCLAAEVAALAPLLASI